MTVEELIEILNQIPDKTKAVCVWGRDCNWTEADFAEDRDDKVVIDFND